MSETFRLWRHGAPLAVLEDERALRLCLPVLEEQTLVTLERNLRCARLRDRNAGIIVPHYFTLEVGSETWMWRRDARR